MCPANSVGGTGPVEGRGVVKKNLPVYTAALTLLAALAIPVWLAAQEQQREQKQEPLTTIVSGSSSQPALRFIPITSCRIADTRNTPDGPFSGPSIAGGTSRDFVIPNSACGIPSTAAAYSLNVAVVPQGPLGYLTVWPTGQSQPLVAALNSDGRVKSNAAIVPAGTNGAISAFATNTTDLVLDINGYFVPSSNTGALQFYPLTPCRVADTRNANGPLGGPFIPGGQSRTFPILSSSCGVPSGAQAYSLNLAAVPRGPLGYLTAWATGQPQPFVATLNAPTGTVTANAAIVAAGASGQIDVFATNDTDLVIDTNGYFAAPGTSGLSLYNLSPCRVLDTRNPPGTPPFTGQTSVDVAGSGCSPPSVAQAYVFNATVVPAGPLGYLTLWPQGETQPLVATLNAEDAAITSNMAIVATNDGSISAWATYPTQLVLDIFGYFGPNPDGPNAALSATSLVFGNELEKTTSPAESITLTNYGTMALNITSITASTNFGETNTCGSSLALGASCTISVTFTPGVSGSLSGTLSVTDNAPGSPQTVSLSGTATNRPGALTGDCFITCDQRTQDLTECPLGQPAKTQKVIGCILDQFDFVRVDTSRVCHSPTGSTGHCIVR